MRGRPYNLEGSLVVAFVKQEPGCDQQPELNASVRSVLSELTGMLAELGR